MPTYVSSMPLCCLVPSSKFGTRSMRPGICVIEMAIGYPKTLTASSSMPLIVTIGSACDPTSWPLQLKGWEGAADIANFRGSNKFAAAKKMS